MKRFFSIIVAVVMMVTMLSVGVSATTTGKLVSGGIYAFAINCEGEITNITCDDLQTLIPGIGCPEEDTDIPSEDNDAPECDSDIIPPVQDNDTPSGDSGITPPEQDNDNPSEDLSLHEYEKEVIRLVNEIRVKNGLGELIADEELSRVARIKSQDMKENNYFSHTSPVYGSPFDMMKSFGISYKSAGENIARGQMTPQAVVTGWMNSPGHRANILNASYNRIGVGYVADGNYWTQMFIQR